MNYIHQLQCQVKMYRAMNLYWRSAARSFAEHLHSPKFAGPDSDGARKDWIATADVLDWLRETASEAFHAETDAVKNFKLNHNLNHPKQ